MPKLSFFFLLILHTFFFSLSAQSPLVINELDCDTPGIDDKEFLELRSTDPYTPLDGYVVVFFNCSPNAGNTSYLALDLDGYRTDINGLLLIGSTTVTPFPQYIIPVNMIQNGQDALAIYRGDAEDFPEGTLPYVDDSLVDVLVYGTNDPDAVSALAVFRAFNPDISQISEGPGNNTNSIQRDNNGGYFVASPTPRRLNDGTGIVLNGLLTQFDKSVYTEGDPMQITFTTENVVEKDLEIRCVFGSEPFSNQTVTGNLLPVLKAGTSEVVTEVLLNDDTFNNSDSDLILTIQIQDSTILVLDNGTKVRVNDNDFTVSDYGTPLFPTFGKVTKDIPAGYYDALMGLSGQDLKLAVQNIIADPEVVRAQTYNDVIDILKEADESPENSNQIWQVYLENTKSKIDFQLGSSNIDLWNREHTWPRSRGGFGSIELDNVIDGKDVFWTTNADSLRHANSDAHGLRAADGRENSNRGDKFYGDYTGPSGTQGSFRGDVARGVFFLDVRYNGLEVVEGFPSETGKFGDLNTLLAWHRQDPPDDFESHRNNVVYDWQKNRNPFIDLPELAEYLWGDKQGDVWQGPSSVTSIIDFDVTVFPNPGTGDITIEVGKTGLHAVICDVQGRVIAEKSFDYNTTFHTTLSLGTYIVRVSDGLATATKKIVVSR
jgi:hypothetical protein